LWGIIKKKPNGGGPNVVLIFPLTIYRYHSIKFYLKILAPFDFALMGALALGGLHITVKRSGILIGMAYGGLWFGVRKVGLGLGDNYRRLNPRGLSIMDGFDISDFSAMVAGAAV
jgi:hypothetical protein